jgi:hypothetical protein
VAEIEIERKPKPNILPWLVGLGILVIIVGWLVWRNNRIPEPTGRLEKTGAPRAVPAPAARAEGAREPVAAEPMAAAPGAAAPTAGEPASTAPAAALPGEAFAEAFVDAYPEPVPALETEAERSVALPAPEAVPAPTPEGRTASAAPERAREPAPPAVKGPRERTPA